MLLMRNSWHLPAASVGSSAGALGVPVPVPGGASVGSSAWGWVSRCQFPPEKNAACPHLLSSACRSKHKEQLQNSKLQGFVGVKEVLGTSLGSAPKALDVSAITAGDIFLCAENDNIILNL